MKNLYTWKDVEVVLEKERQYWPATWKKVDVYNDEIIILKTEISGDSGHDKDFLIQIFGNYYDAKRNVVCIRDFSVELPIIWEEDDFDTYQKEVIPLFKSVLFSNSIEIPEKKKKLSGRPIIAFHSYKGGVGRTLALTSLLKEISSLYGNEKKVLVIDSDLEAPGLTWTIEKSSHFPVSYMDFLSIIRTYKAEKRIIDKIAELMQRNLIYIETEKERVEHFFLPAYIEESQLATAFARPEQILDVSEDRFLISEAISKLGEALHADLVLVDLRAGISEISAPLLFDARVDKYFVSSTSLQSIMGTRMIQEQVYAKTKLAFEHFKIVVNMIPQDMSTDIRMQSINELVQIPEQHFDTKNATFLRDEYVIDVNFEAQLLRQNKFEDACEVLTGTDMAKKMNKVARELFMTEITKSVTEKARELPEQMVREGLKKLNVCAEVTAEAGSASEMLLTDSLTEIIRGNQKEIPNLVVLGAKGSGKTYLYRQLVHRKTWRNFIRATEGKRIEDNSIDAIVIPVLATANDKNIDIKKCIAEVSSYFGAGIIDEEAFGKLRTTINKIIGEKHTSAEWASVWREQLLKVFNNRFCSMKELNSYLENCQKNVIFLIDGLDDLQNYEQSGMQNYLTAIQALTQGVIKELDYIHNRHMGMMVFLRRDIAEEAIQNNFRQFSDQYSRYELNWSQTEALRLALWVAGKAISQLDAGEKILLLSREEIEKRLELLWGKKLGKDESKEAATAKWILAALSDFNGQLQARDIVRFLKYASEDSESVNLQMVDRYLMPRKIRDAIGPCAAEKMTEIKMEMPRIYAILQKFNDRELQERTLPLDLDKISLSVEELDRLERQGFLKISDKKYYLSEIIRQALGFRYKVGARPKVLSLLIK